MKLNKYVVIFSYAIPVEGESEEKAIRRAASLWAEINPSVTEMNCEVEREV